MPGWPSLSSSWCNAWWTRQATRLHQTSTNHTAIAAYRNSASAFGMEELQINAIGFANPWWVGRCILGGSKCNQTWELIESNCSSQKWFLKKDNYVRNINMTILIQEGHVCAYQYVMSCTINIHDIPWPKQLHCSPTKRRFHVPWSACDAPAHAHSQSLACTDSWSGSSTSILGVVSMLKT